MKGLTKKLLVLGVSSALAHGVLAQQSQQPGQSSAERSQSAQQQPGQSSSAQQRSESSSQQPGQSSAQPRSQSSSQQPGQSSSAQQRSQSSSQQAAQSQSQQQPQSQQQSQARSQQQSQAGGQALEQLSQEHDNLSTFVELLEETGLASSITGQGQSYTAFAPTDEAFDQHGGLEDLRQPENREQLVELLRDHLIADELDAERAGQIGQALTVSGKTLTLEEEGGNLMVNGTQVADTDIRAGGLIVHTIDQVLEPTGSAQLSSAAGQQGGQSQASSQQPAGSSQAGASQQQRPSQAGQQPGAGQRQAGGDYPEFEEVDQNSDGQLSRTELARVEGLDFSEADSNQDGNVSRSEYMQATQN